MVTESEIRLGASVIINDDGAFGYHSCNVGLNNQKFALLGMFCAAVEQNKPIRLPLIANFNPCNAKVESLVPYENVFDLDAILKFADAIGVKVIRDGNTTNNTTYPEMFTYGNIKARESWLDTTTLPGRFWAALQPCQEMRNTVAIALQKIFSGAKKRATCQIRIENDWKIYSEKRFSNLKDEEATTSYERILAKLWNTFSDKLNIIYVTWDEDALPTSPQVIADHASERYGYQLRWKSNINHGINANDFSRRSLLDFEIGVASDIFIGTSRSTFANNICHAASVRNAHHVTSHFIYNALSENVVERHDHGREANPVLATALPISLLSSQD